MTRTPSSIEMMLPASVAVIEARGAVREFVAARRARLFSHYQRLRQCDFVGYQDSVRFGRECGERSRNIAGLHVDAIGMIPAIGGTRRDAAAMTPGSAMIQTGASR